MKKITATNQLQEMIVLLEIEHLHNEELVKAQFKVTYDSLKPVNIIKNTIQDVLSTPILNSSMLQSAIGIVTGYFSKKAVVGESHNKVREIAGTILQFGVTKVIAGNPEVLHAILRYVSKHVFHKKDGKTTREHV